MAATNRSTGTVKWFSARKGFGFIAPDDGGEDLFVHQTSIQSHGFRTLSEGQPVEFTVDFGGDDGSRATDVVGLSRSLSTPSGRSGGFARRGFPGWRGRDSRGYNTGGGGFGRGGRGGQFGGGGGGGGGSCYNCGRYGHLARDCYQGSGGGGSRRFGGGGGGGGGGCYNCGEEGHFARDCPNTDRK